MEIVIIIGLILLNGLFSMSEIALVSARKSRLELDARKGSKSAKAALHLSGEPDRFLSTIQIGITLIGILTGLYSGEAFAGDLAQVILTIDILAPYSVIIAKTIIVIVVTYLTLVLGELVPKRLGLNMAERVSKLVAKPMNLLSRIASPVVWLLSVSTSLIIRFLGIRESEDSKVTEEEIKAIIKESVEHGEVQAAEHDIVERVFSLDDRNVASIMTHRSDLVWFDISDTKEQIRQKVIDNMHEQYLVASRNLDNILGVVYMKDLFGNLDNSEFNLQNLIRPPQYMPENQNVYEALEQFRKANVKYGFVIDEFGDIQGVVTLKDIMQALVGNVHSDGEEQEIVVREDGTLLIDGQCPFYNFLEHFELEYLISDHDYNTLSGLILEILGHIPTTGEKLSWRNFHFEIIDLDGARIDKVLVTHYK